MEKKEIDILDILLILVKHKKFIVITTLIVSVAAVIYSLVIPEYWLSTATILPSSSKENSFSVSSGVLGGFASSMLGGGQSDAYELTGIMESRTFSLDVVKKFDLVKYLEIDEPDTLISYQIAIETLKENIANFNINDNNNFLSISIETKDKYLSADIANYYWMKLDEYNKSVKMTKGKQNRIFIEERLETVKSKIKSLSSKIKQFQEENKVIELDEQTSKIISLYSDLMSQKFENEIKRDYGLKFFEFDSPEIEKLKTQIAVLNDKLKEITTTSKTESYILPIDNIPELARQFAELQLEFTVQKQIYEFLYPQYESAKIDELKDLPTIEIIDKAVPAGKRSKPKRAIICIISFILALVFSSSFVLIRNTKEIKNDD